MIGTPAALLAPPCSTPTPIPPVFPSLAQLEAAVPGIRHSPPDLGTVALIVRRPAVDVREVLTEGTLSTTAGLVGDNWAARTSSKTPDGTPHPEMQLTLMNARVIGLLTTDWGLAGDQLFVDLDLSATNLPAGTRLAVGAAVLEITAQPHLGCAKFAARFGRDALRFVNSTLGKELHLRGVYAKVVRPGTVRTGDRVAKEAASAMIAGA